MKFLSPEIEALYKRYYGDTNKKSLVRQSTSCGIFQDFYEQDKTQNSFHKEYAKKHNLNL